MASGKPDFSVRTVAPQPDPWLNEAAQRGYNGPPGGYNGTGMDFSRPGQLGNAWTDQFNSSLLGREPYVDPNEGNVYRGAINSSGQRVESDADPTPQGESDGDPLARPADIIGPPIPSRNPISYAPLQPAIHPNARYNINPKTRQMTTVPWEAPKNAYRDTNGRVRYETAPTGWNRFARGVVGAFQGPDYGNRLVNGGAHRLAWTNPITGILHSGAGAVSRATSRNPVTKTWNPQDDALDQALNDPNAGRQTEDNDEEPGMTANQATLNASRNAPPTNAFSSGGGSPSTFNSMLGGGDYTDPNYNSGGGSQIVQNPNAPPSATGSAPPAVTPTTPPETPPTTPPTGGTPPNRNPDPVTNPENRVNPQTGLPDPNGVLPQHMPGYVPPTYISNTRDGKLAVDALYQKYYGRNSTPEEFQAHVGNPGGIKAVEAALKTAPDALPQNAPPVTNTPPGTPPPGAQTGAGSGGGGYSYLGFDFGQDPANRDIGKSAKYAFSYFAGQAASKGIPQPRNKQEAQAWFEQHIAPGMNAQGFTVHKVVGDKAFISTREVPGGQWVDFQGNSGGQGDQPLTWQAENTGQGADADAEALYAVTNAGGGGGGGGTSGMGRGEGEGLGGVLDTNNPALNGFASRLIQQLLEGAALDDVLEREQQSYRGLTPASLKAVGF